MPHYDPIKWLLLLLRLLSNKEPHLWAYREKYLWHPFGTNKEVIQTLLKLHLLKPYTATIVMGKTPTPYVTDLTLSGGRNLQIGAW